jgi:hypothetical protein
MADCLEQKGYRIACNPYSGGPACLHTLVDTRCEHRDALSRDELREACSNFTTIMGNFPSSSGCRNPSLPPGDSYAAGLLHEMIHGAGCEPGLQPDHNDPPGTSLPGDRVFGCEEKCFPGSTLGMGYRDDCR